MLKHCWSSIDLRTWTIQISTSLNYLNIFKVNIALAPQLPKGIAILLIHLYDLYNIFFHGLNEHMCLSSKAIPSNITSHFFFKDPIVLDKTKLSFNVARSCLKFVSTSCYTYTILMATMNSKSRNQCCSSQKN